MRESDHLGRIDIRHQLSFAESVAESFVAVAWLYSQSSRLNWRVSDC
jgi:hypothetical protein